MNAPTVVVVVSLAAATLLLVSLMIATGTRTKNLSPARAAAPASLISSAGR